MPLVKAHERKNGLWEAKGIDPATSKPKSYYSRTKEEAIRKAMASYGFQSDNTLDGFYATVYLPTVAHRSQNWLDQIKWAMDKHVRPAFGAKDITTITRADLQKFFNGLTTLSPSSKARVKIVLSGVLGLAASDEVIPSNPCTKVRLPSPQAPNKRALSPVELNQLLTASQDRLRPFLLLTAFCGLRAGEALGVTRHAIKNGTLSVTQQVLQLKGGCKVYQRLKTPQSRRDIPLPQGLEQMLLNAGQVSAIWVCSDSEGGYLSPTNAHRELEEAIVRAKVPRVTPHELRHTFISILENDLEVAPAIVAALSGKVGSGVTASYSHARPAQLRKAMERFWELVTSSKEGALRLNA